MTKPPTTRTPYRHSEFVKMIREMARRYGNDYVAEAVKFSLYSKFVEHDDPAPQSNNDEVIQFKPLPQD
jgi:hypothetical protein